jgi:hypothetical protein
MIPSNWLWKGLSEDAVIIRRLNYFLSGGGGAVVSGIAVLCLDLFWLFRPLRFRRGVGSACQAFLKLRYRGSYGFAYLREFFRSEQQKRNHKYYRYLTEIQISKHIGLSYIKFVQPTTK